MTTDDCYTPPTIYEIIKDWACAEYGIDPARIVRPFYPGGDYENYDYPPGCVVLDNPPFSILAKIIAFYLDRDIAFFLFAPSLTALSNRARVLECNHIICDVDIVYANGAKVRTAFVTSFGGDIVMQTAPELGRAINAAVAKLKADQKAALPKYEYPDHIVTAAIMQRYAHYGIDFAIRRADCKYVPALDAQRKVGKAIFGGGLLLSDRAAAERAAAHKWELSARERAIVAGLGEGGGVTDASADEPDDAELAGQISMI